MEIGQTLHGQINNINERGIYVTLPDGGFGHMPFRLKKSEIPIRKWDWMDVVVYKIYDNQSIQLCDREYWESERHARVFAETAEPGEIYEATVQIVERECIKILLGADLEGIITRDNISWNRIERPEDIVYAGEPVNVVYIGFREGLLQFALRYLNEKPYDEEMYSLSLSELLKYAGHSGTAFIGKACQYQTYWLLENICSANPGEEGRLLTDPDYGHNLRAIAPASAPLEEGKYYNFTVNLVEKGKRLERNQLYQFQASGFEETRDPYSFDTLQIFKKNTSPRTNVTVAHLLAEVGKNMYSSKDRMFYELIQNADDASAKKGVRVKVDTAGDYLTLSHNGFSFNKDDFEAITSAANGTKKANENKTGYKGIGFKSVFTDSEQVYIKTGGYQFKFDKSQPQFQDFEKFYFFVNELSSPEEKATFLSRFNTEYNNFNGVKDIPWQMEPIWVRSFPEDIPLDNINSNVFIALRLGRDKIEAQNGYREIIEGIMANPRFMLFLRNTRRIDFNDRSVSKEINDGIVTIKNSFNDSRHESFKRKDHIVPVDDTIFQQLGIDIRRRIIEHFGDQITDATFVNSNGQEYGEEEIPKKIAIANSTEISFAVPFDRDTQNVKPDTKCTQVSMFAYLPTMVKDFKFPFFINANFILDSSRERIKGDNPWNYYLMAQIAELTVTWVTELCALKEPEALNMLLAQYLDETSTDTEMLAKYFNDSYRNALGNAKFILDMNGKMSSQEEIILDGTGLSDIVGSNVFCRIIGTEKRLPSPAIDSKILKKPIFDKVQVIDASSLAEVIVDNSELKNWIGIASQEKLSELFTWLNRNQDDYPMLAQSLPVFKFGDQTYSANDIANDSNLIITTVSIVPIKDILCKLGFQCSDIQIENSPLKDCITLRSAKSIFESISLKVSTNAITTAEKYTLLSSLEGFENVGIASIASLKIVRNADGTYAPLSSMVAYREDAPQWIKPYMVCKGDYSSELDRYLVNGEHEFSDIVWKNISSISASVDDLYNVYKWTESRYTTQLIDQRKPSEMINIVEVSDLSTKRYFLSKVKLQLKSSEHYKADSLESRILKLAKASLDKPIDFSAKVFLDDKCIQTISIKDTCSCKYYNNGVEKTATFNLSRLLPEHNDGSASVSALKSLFDNHSDIECFIVAKEKSTLEIFKELNTKLNIPEAYFSKWPTGLGNATQYLFSVYYRRSVKGWNNAFVPTIDLSKETQEFVSELMEFLFCNSVFISNSSFTYHLSKSVKGLYFNNDFVSDSEKLLPAIEAWADTGEKVKFLLDNGAIPANGKSVLLRKALVEDTAYEDLDKTSDEIAFAALTYLATTHSDCLPTTDGYRKQLIEAIIRRPNAPIVRSIDSDKLQNGSAEYATEEYLKWSEGHSTKIFLYPGGMPYLTNLKSGNGLVLLIHSSEGEYYTSPDKKTLYINGDSDLDTLLFRIAKEGKTALSLDDYKTLCIDGKTFMSKSELENMNHELAQLKQEVLKKDELIHEYEKRLGISANYEADGPAPSIQKGTSDSLSMAEKKDAQVEAQRFLMQIEPSWVFPSGYGEMDDEGEPCCFSTEEVATPEGNIFIVLKSHIMEDAPLKVNPQEWEYMIKKNALLLIYTGDDIKRLHTKDLIMDQDKIVLTFSTENLDIEERIDAFARSLHYFKQLQFDFDSFNLSKKAESIKGITNLNSGQQDSGLGDNDI